MEFIYTRFHKFIDQVSLTGTRTLINEMRLLSGNHERELFHRTVVLVCTRTIVLLIS